MEACKGFLDSVYCGSGVDGAGLRVVVFFSGCNLRCPFCHNPETLFRQGREETAEAVAARCFRYRPYLRKGGVTLSGGEPFFQRDFCLSLIERLHAGGMDVAVETNGQIADERLIAAADSFLVDVKNQETDDVCAYDAFLAVCDRRNKPVVLTNVLVPGKNDGEEKIAALRKLAAHACVGRVKFLPFRKLCAEKYERLNLPFLYEPYREAEEADLLRAEAILKGN